MGVFDNAKYFDPNEPPPEEGLDELAVRGLRAGTYTMRGQASKLAGTAMGALGLDGSGRMAASAEDQAAAQRQNEGLTQLHDVHDVRSGLRWGAGALGGIAPMAGGAIGAGLLAPAGALPMMAAGAASMLPFEMGGQLQRQDEDSANAARTPGQRLLAALPGAAGASALQAVVPGGVAMRVAGRAGAQGLGRIGLRAAADVPANAVASAGAEGARQFSDNLLNPNAGYDMDKVKEAGIEGGAVGALFGGVGAAGHLVHSSAGAIKAAPGRAIDAAKGLVPEGAKKAADGVGEAAATAPDVAAKVIDWAKGSIKERTNDVRAWGREFMADEALDGSIKQQVQEAIDNPGDKARQVWLATLKFGQDAKAKLKDADIPAQLRGLRKSMKDQSTALMERMSRGEETADPAAMEADPQAAQASADKTSFEKAQQWGSELLDTHLGEEKTAQLKQAMATLGDKASQVTIAGIKLSQDAIKSTRAAIDRFSDGVKAEAPAPGAKRSEDYSGANRVIGEAVRDVLGEDHPALDTDEGVNRLAAGLRPFIEQVASGKAFSSLDKLDQLNDLFDIAGDKTTALLHAVHQAVSAGTKDEKAVYRTLGQMQDIYEGRQSILETMAKNLRPELQGKVSMTEMRLEADMFAKWARSDTARPGEASGKEKRAFGERQMRALLEEHYGAKADAVLKAVEANMAKEQNVLEQARVKTDDEGNAVGADSTDMREKSAADETSTVKYYAENKQLYLHPDLDETTGSHDSAAVQRMKAAQKQNPDATVQFRRVSEMDQADPKVKAMVEAKRADLVDEGLANGKSQKDAEAWADKHLNDYGSVTAEMSRQETALTSAELKSVSLDAKNYGSSKSRIDTHGKGEKDNVIIDAVKLTRFMDRKLSKPDDYLDQEGPGSTARKARMFKEGVAAVQAQVGRAFEVPDATVIAHRDKTPVTWGEVRKIDSRTKADKEYDADTERLVELRKEFKAAKDTLGRDRAREKARDIISKRELAVLRESVGGDQQRQGNDEAGFEGNVKRGLVLNKVRMREIEAELSKIDNSTSEGRAKEAKLMEEFGRLSVGRNASTDKIEPNLGSGRSEIDPFGQVHDVLRGGDPKGAQIRTNSSGLPRGEDIQGRRRPATSQPHATRLPERKVTAEPPERVAGVGHEYGTKVVQVAKEMSASSIAAQRALGAKLHALIDGDHKMTAKDIAALEAIGEMKLSSERGPAINRLAQKYPTAEEAPPDPKAIAAKQAAFVEKVRSGDAATLKAVRESADAKGLQRAVEHLARLKDAKLDEMIATINARIAELIDTQPGVAYGMQTKRYSLMSTEVHKDLGRRGFAATHDSPIKHEGKFDWRKHAGTGEGADMFGAGLYLSSGEGVHKYYKALFTQAAGETSPTYHVSVDIAPEHIMNWDKPLSEQSAHVRAALKQAGFEGKSRDRPLEWEKDNGDDVTFAGERYATVRNEEAGSTLYVDGEYQGVFKSAAEAKLEARALLGGEDMTGEVMYRSLANRMGSNAKASERLQSLGILAHEYAAANGRNGKTPNYVIYDDSKVSTNYVHFSLASAEHADPNHMGPADRKAVEDYFTKTLGPNIGVHWTDILHAGEFERTATGDIVRLSVHSLNPMSAAYHESLHGFFARLADAKQSHISDVLEKAGNAAPVMNQLRKLLANEPDALKQLANPEERAAYMYQFWAQGKLTVGSKVETLFGRIAAFIREVTGMWTNAEQAEKIMAYFHSGEYEKGRSDPNAVSRVLADSTAARAVEKLRSWTGPLREMGEVLASAGGARLRDSGIPALRELADAMKLKTTSQGQDAGFVPASRAERSRLMNQLSTDLRAYSKDTINEALEAMQSGVKAQSSEARAVALTVHRRLDETLKYMQDAGVHIESLGMKGGVPYFPRSWDASYISSHQKEFLAMAEKYVKSGQWKKGDPIATMQKLMVTDGAEFGVEVDKPGMQSAKQRVLSFIDHADAAPFMRKDLFGTLNSYITQATRRAEWARRFGDDGSRLTKLLARASDEGATREQLKGASSFVHAVNGTLGDTIDPARRRLFGNMIVYQNIRLLPLAIFSSMVDAQGVMVRGGTVGESFKTFKRGAAEMIKNFQKEPATDGMTQLAETLGVVDSAVLVHTLGASYSQGMVGDRGRAINDTFFRLNLMEQYNTSMRVGATEAAMNFLVRHATKPGQHSERFLRELGLEAKDVQVDAEGRPKLLESDGLTLEHAAKMKAAVNRWVDGAILRPDAVDKPVWMSDPNWALIAHLKQFVFSFHETILKRTVHEARHGNYSPAMALASYVPMMIAADALKGLIQGGGSQPSWKEGWGPEDYVWSGMERAGLFGTGQFGVDMLTDVHRGGVGIGALAGPTIDQLTDGVRALGGREQFGAFALKSLPANALYASALKSGGTGAADPNFSE